MQNTSLEKVREIGEDAGVRLLLHAKPYVIAASPQ